MVLTSELQIATVEKVDLLWPAIQFFVKVTQNVNIKLFTYQNKNTKNCIYEQPKMLFVLFLAGIASASLSEDFNKNPDLYYRILLKLDD